MYCTQSGPPHIQRCRRLPRPWPVVVPVLPDQLVPVLLAVGYPVPQQRRRRLPRRGWQPICATSVVTGEFACFLLL